ncbi:hypothetical protein QE152_g30521 [Popillia japonica]|uniref:Uncharacterized protein n=1 Tax=Popillia japonica TaxID=7064 RepID=A0AAW1JEG0_POPJA
MTKIRESLVQGIQRSKQKARECREDIISITTLTQGREKKKDSVVNTKGQTKQEGELSIDDDIAAEVCGSIKRQKTQHFIMFTLINGEDRKLILFVNFITSITTKCLHHTNNSCRNYDLVILLYSVSPYR